MSSIIEHFLEITKIPHCSKDADKLCDFLVEFAKDRGYEVEIDSVKNIFIHKGKPNLSLQAHYDMVCMGKAPNIETYVENGWMMAKESSLGADNGMAIAMMMELMDRGEELEFLLTSDEEIGLIGANEVGFKLHSKYMLNLDSEDEAEVYIGCAGGVDITATYDDELVETDGYCYEISVKGLDGGHSGVDIDKDIVSAKKVLASYMGKHESIELCSMYAGERRNSIPANAVAVVKSKAELKSLDGVEVRELKESAKVFKNSQNIIALLNNFQHGVHTTNSELGIPHTSINLAITSVDEKGGMTIETSARAMDEDSLKDISLYAQELFLKHEFSVSLEDKYPSWKPDVSDFTNIVDEEMKNVFGKSKLMAIHAGLECGVIAQKYPGMKFASIGPNIRFPHSTREMVELSSVEKTFEVLTNIIERVKL